MAQPKPKGRIMPAADTLSAILQFLIKVLRFVSTPIMNKKRTNPKLATRLSVGRDSGGKMACRNPGILPITEGPNRIPPITSDITRGCRILERG